MPSRGHYAKGAARREEILSTALHLISERGLHRISLRSIGRALGLEPAHLLYYFSSREELLREVVERWDAESTRLVAADADSLEMYVAAVRHNQAIRGVVHLYLAFAVEAVDIDHPAHAYFAGRFETVVSLLAGAIHVAREAGRIRPEIDPQHSARMLIALADGLQLQSLFLPSIDVVADLEAAVDALFVSGTRDPAE